MFGDRLIDQTDISWLVKEIRVTLTNRMFIDIDDLFEDLIISREKVNFFLISRGHESGDTTLSRG